MEVHDVRNPTPTLEPGYIFTIEPQMTMESGELSVRLEDMILMTETGYENMSSFVPVEIEEIERLMTQPGLSRYALRLPKTAAQPLSLTRRLEEPRQRPGGEGGGGGLGPINIGLTRDYSVRAPAARLVHSS